MARRILIVLVLLAVTAVIATAQFRGGRSRGYDRGDIPTWDVNPNFHNDIFTFVRVQFNTGGGGRFGGRGWTTDFPNADLNFSWRLHQMTSLEVDPDATSLDLTDPRLTDYPFLFMIDPRSIQLSHQEAESLRNYLLTGGFLMVDDFWGDQMWNHIYRQMKLVFPDIEPRSLTPDHPIYRIVFPLEGPVQVPSEDSAHRNMNASGLYRTWEDEISYERPQPPDYRGYFDKKGRLMALVCWNTDLSDGWEEEGVSPWFFENYAEKYSYPMGINILFYVMTH